MAILKLPDNGQETQLADEIAKSDDLLKQALAIVMPGASNIDIKREEKDGVLTVTVVKKAGTKGNYLEVLKAAPDEINPAIVLAHEFQARETAGDISWDELLTRGSEIDQAVAAGEGEAAVILKFLWRMKGFPAVASSVVPEGF
jgi:hypothetical protein